MSETHQKAKAALLAKVFKGASQSNMADEIMDVLAPFLRSEPAAASVPLSAETAPAERERLLALDDRVLALTLKGQPLTATDQSQVRSVIRQLLAAPAVSREASVPQGGEFTAAEVEALVSEFLSPGGANATKLVRMLRAYARSLSSAPGEREGR